MSSGCYDAVPRRRIPLRDSRISPSAASSANPESRRKIGFGTFVWLVLLLVGLGIVRSAIATRLNGFTIDEAYHIAAGVSYVKYGDFRINPKHPPLVKLRVGSVIAATGFHMDPLADKIADVNTSFYHSVLSGMNATHIVPRAYLWGFADTVRAGMEGRLSPQTFFGKLYVRRGPKYFFPAMIAVKLPIGLSVLSLLGLILFFARRLPAEWTFPAGVILAAALLFLLVLAQGATYAGIRHALPVVALLSIFAGLFTESALASSSRSLKIAALAAYVLACSSAIPVLRPWEYFNEFVGGAKNAHKYFDDEGVDLGQRSKELVEYYSRYITASGGMVHVIYLTSEDELKARNVEFLGRDMDRDLPLLSRPERYGTIFASTPLMCRNTFWDRRALREAAPVARFGNLFVYQGTFFYLPRRLPLSIFMESLNFMPISPTWLLRNRRFVNPRKWILPPSS